MTTTLVPTWTRTTLTPTTTTPANGASAYVDVPLGANSKDKAILNVIIDWDPAATGYAYLHMRDSADNGTTIATVPYDSIKYDVDNDPEGVSVEIADRDFVEIEIQNQSGQALDGLTIQVSWRTWTVNVA